ncbi:DNA cytosine methyltransferase [Methyloversatilis sp.]|uniref:DNA cytosine methyltransferase n=1 Tax=Methyloversatilis sp. TaxID=2569862 RepID=UPI002732888A|nr:DNA cytosine methyltransferase [Methyloversatilis sp.]MDP3579109.1 DNA cytosine methyltransferase [Methyloversatilis sp.]
MKRDAFTTAPDDVRDIRHFHLFCGLGGGARGFNAASARVGSMTGRFRCIGGIDVDPASIRDFGRLAGVPGTVLDLFDRDQYCAFHGAEPPAGWRESTTADIHRAAGGERPHIVFLSAPCKGFSGLLAEGKSRTDKYQALNRLTLRGVWLMLEAWSDDPPELILFENVPRIATRGRHLLDQITALLRQYGYAVAETTHDCGQLGGLAQSRKRFLLVARHMAKVPPFLYEPAMKRLQGVGTVLGRMPLPGDAAGGPMHRVPALMWKTWVRLAFVEAGSDWRSLNRLAIEGGNLRDYLIVPEMFRGALGVRRWDETTGAVAGESLPMNGAFSVADPRFEQSAKWSDGQAYGVRKWDAHTGTVSGKTMPGQGAFAVSDPRMPPSDTRHYNMFRVIDWRHPSNCVTGSQQIGSGAMAVSDPRPAGELFGKYAVTDWTDAAGTVISGSTTGQGAYAVADPRPGMQRQRGDHYLTGGHYGVVPWSSSSGAVSASACHDNGPWSVADPRLEPTGAKTTPYDFQEWRPDAVFGMGPGAFQTPQIPGSNDRVVAVIRAEDGTWHRPFTTLELAALQSLVDPEEQLELDGLSDSDWRERIGNAVPPDASQAIASEMGRTLLLAWSGETFTLSSAPIWVQPALAALTVAQGDLNV